jgi:hypothetical protein
MHHLARYFFPALWSFLILGAGFLWVRQEIANRIYREKLDSLASEYAALASHYNEAVQRTAVTELEVTPSGLSVLIRTADGAIRRIETPFDPNREIYVDYLVGDGRIWIRRVFDDATAPGDGLVIDPVWSTVDWGTGSPAYGKAVYRSLEPGIWSIQVSGSGALSLEPAPASRPGSLVAAPPVRRYEEIQVQLDQEIREIGFADIRAFCFSLLP